MPCCQQVGETIDLAMLLLLLFVLGHHRAGACGAPVVVVLQGAVSRTQFAHSQPCSMRTLCMYDGQCCRSIAMRSFVCTWLLAATCLFAIGRNVSQVSMFGTCKHGSSGFARDFLGWSAVLPVFLKLLLDPVATVLGALITSAWFHTFRPTLSFVRTRD